MLAAAYLTSYPIDTVQTRMMMTSGEVLKYKSCTDVFMQIIKNEGILSLYKGSGASLLSMILSLSLMSWFRKLQNGSTGTISVVIDTDT